MIQEFVDKFIANEVKVRAAFASNHPGSYRDIVQTVIWAIAGYEPEYGQPNHKGITQINDGDYQGTLVFVIPEQAYQPHDYWFVKVWYGSCSGCDTLEAIRDAGSWSDAQPNQGQIDDYYTLALHVAQGLKSMQDA